MKRISYTSSQLRHGLVGIVLFLVGLAGCSDPRGTVSGTVYYEGKIVKGGTVVFVSDDDKKQDRAEIKADGTYTSKNVPIGEKIRIGVEPAPKGIANLMKDKGKKPTNIPDDGPSVYAKDKDGKEFVDIPQILRDPATSKVFTKVEKGEQTFDIKLPPK